MIAPFFMSHRVTMNLLFHNLEISAPDQYKDAAPMKLLKGNEVSADPAAASKAPRDLTHGALLPYPAVFRRLEGRAEA